MAVLSSSSRLLAGASVLWLAACAHAPKPPLYMWENFPRQQYASLLGESAGPEGQIQAMEAHAEKARAAHAALPPGFRAHMGMLYLSTGNASMAREMWQAEKAAFPESSAYVDSLLRKLDGAASATPASKDKPA